MTIVRGLIRKSASPAAWYHARSQTWYGAWYKAGTKDCTDYESCDRVSGVGDKDDKSHGSCEGNLDGSFDGPTEGCTNGF